MALRRAGSKFDRDGRSRTTRFRRSFLVAFGMRIGQRLRDTVAATVTAADAETSVALIPILAERDAAAKRAQPAQRLTELVAFDQEMARNMRGDTLAGWWLDGTVDILGGANPLDEIAEGRYKRMIHYTRGISHGSSRRRSGTLRRRGNT